MSEKRAKKTQRYPRGGPAATVGETFDDVPQTDRSHFAPIHAQQLQFPGAVFRALKDRNVRAWRWLVMLILTIVVGFLLLIVVSLITASV